MYWFRSHWLKAAILLSSLLIIYLCVEYRAMLLNYVIETFLIEKKDCTEGRVNAFYVGMKRSSVIAELGKMVPSSVEAEPSSSFKISNDSLDDWKKVTDNSDIGVM